MNSLTLFILLCFTAFLNFFFFRTVGYFGTQLFLLGFLTFIVALSITRNRFKQTAHLFLYSFCGLFIFSVLILMRDNSTVLSLLQWTSVFLVTMALYATVSQHPHVIALMEVVSIPFITIKLYLQAAKKLLSGKSSTTSVNLKSTFNTQLAQFSRFRPIIVGVLLSAPISFILISLFAKADPVFESFIKNIVGQSFLENMIWRAILSLVIYGIGLPILLMKKEEPFHNPVQRLNKWQLVTEFSVVMSVVGAIIAVFLIVQWKYIFVPAVSGVNLSQYGVQTYSEYVNRGFTELLAASLFIFGLIWTGLILMRNKTTKSVSILKTLQLVVLIEFVILLFSVFRRIVLYQQYHGMSLVRFYGGYFLVFLFCLTITLFLRHILKLRFVIAELLIVGVSVVGLALFNAERYIAVYHPPTVNNRIDYVYLSRMSADGFDGWKKSYDWTKQILEQSYPQGSMISTESRRQIAYAGITLEQLLSRYHELIMQQGNQEEMRNYYQIIHADLMKQLDASWAALDVLQPAVLASGDEKLIKELSGHRKSLTDARAQVQAQIDLLQKGELFSTDTQLHPNTPVDYYSNNRSGKIQFTNTKCSYWSLCYFNSYSSGVPNTFYRISHNSSHPYRSETSLDKVLSWSPTQEFTFTRMKQELPLTSLLDLQQKYVKLYQHISRQPESEREYDADLSLGTPFLKSLQ